VDIAAYLQPRDRPAAKRAAAALMLVAAALTGAFAVAVPAAGGAWVVAVSYAVPIGLIAMTTVLYTVPERWLVLLWVPAPIVGIVAVAGLALTTRDSSAGAQVVLCYPMIYAASQLRAYAAAVTAAFAVAADAVVAFSLQPVAQALNSLSFVGATLLAMTVLLALSARRQDRLVALLRERAAIDPLTGLVTRRVLDDAAQAALRGAAEEGTALIMLDVDRFKVINDTYGHPVGDSALVHIAGTLAAHSRPHDVICRIGGDEIAVLLPRCPREVSVARAEQFVAAVRNTPLPLADGTRLALSVSIGVAHTETRAALALRELYAAADAALYDAKRSGRDRVGVLTASPGPPYEHPPRP
jgi:diguanylate cyclase (GGDEF)-like protein